MDGQMEAASFSQSQRDTLGEEEIAIIIKLERTGATLSLIGVLLVIATYAAFRRLRTVPNLFILFASISNIGASIACIVGYDGIKAGVDTSLCQAQAFLLELFMQADPWWSFAMAVNVFLVFFLGANPSSFRQHLWVYCLVCFGAPGIPAVACLLIKNNELGKVYGDATLWCWIGPKWNALRIYTYYLPIWICILLSTVIYIAVGYHVFQQRNQLRNLTFSSRQREGKDTSNSEARDSAEKSLTNAPDVYGTVVMEVQVISEGAGGWPVDDMPSEPGSSLNMPCEAHHPPILRDQHSDLRPSRELNAPQQARFETHCTSKPPPVRPGVMARFRGGWRHFTARLRRLDPVKLAYLRTSFIFAISVLITWTPSSINRVYSLIYPNRVSVGLNIASAVVLPLQGVWNAVIYFSTSWSTFKGELKRFSWWRRMQRLDGESTRVEPTHKNADAAKRMVDAVESSLALEDRVLARSMRGQDDLEAARPIGTIRAMQGSF